MVDGRLDFFGTTWKNWFKWYNSTYCSTMCLNTAHLSCSPIQVMKRNKACVSCSSCTRQTLLRRSSPFSSRQGNWTADPRCIDWHDAIHNGQLIVVLEFHASREQHHPNQLPCNVAILTATSSRVGARRSSSSSCVFFWWLLHTQTLIGAPKKKSGGLWWSKHLRVYGATYPAPNSLGQT